MSENAHIRRLERALTILRRIASGYAGQSLKAKGDGYSRTQLDILTLIDEQADRTVKELAGILAMTSGAITQTVETLVKRGLVDRQRDDNDRRFTRLSLTAAGQDAVGQYYAKRSRMLQAITDELSEQELRVMIRIADKLLPQTKPHDRHEPSADITTEK